MGESRYVFLKQSLPSCLSAGHEDFCQIEGEAYQRSILAFSHKCDRAPSLRCDGRHYILCASLRVPPLDVAGESAMNLLLFCFCYHYDSWLHPTSNNHTVPKMCIFLLFTPDCLTFVVSPSCTTLPPPVCLLRLNLATFTMEGVKNSKIVVLKVSADELRKVTQKPPCPVKRKRARRANVSQQTPSPFHSCLPNFRNYWLTLI